MLEVDFCTSATTISAFKFFVLLPFFALLSLPVFLSDLAYFLTLLSSSQLFMLGDESFEDGPEDVSRFFSGDAKPILRFIVTISFCLYVSDARPFLLQVSDAAAELMLFSNMGKSPWQWLKV